MRLLFFYNLILRVEFFLKFKIQNIFQFFFFKNIEIFIILDDINLEEDFLLLNSFFILEFLSLQKPFIKKFLLGSKNSKQKGFFFLFKVTLRKRLLFNFLDYFICCCLPFFKSRQLRLKKIFDKKGDFSFFLKDIHIFFKMPEDFLYFNKGFFFILRLSNNFLNKDILKKFFKFYNFFLI